ncbi:hypothetical protein KAX29_04895, partial [candidate division WOR-3 bacterium]|nr:hypothetical protein [candidate division WOR-3 bacterium]
MTVNEKNINNCKQNKIKYVMADCRLAGIDTKKVSQILLARGIHKWLANRFSIIKYKNALKKKITRTLKEIQEAKRTGHYYHLAKLKGYN